MITSKFHEQVNSSILKKRRQYFYALFSMLLAVLMLAGVWGTTAVFAAAPVITPNQSFDVDENSATGTPVGIVVTTGDPVSSFSIEAGNGGNAFAIDAGGNISVLTGTAIDFEATPIFTLTIRATNIDGSTDEDVVINVNNMNDAPDVAPSHPFSFAENSGIGATVGTIVATDPDNNILDYSIVQWISTPGPFLLNSFSGEITATAQIDYETDQTSYIFVVRVSDGGRSSNTTVTINVTDDNDAPAAVDDIDAAYTIAEYGSLTITTPTVLKNDSDADGDGLTAVKLSDPVNGSVTLNPDGTFTYTPDPGFDGIDTFTYKAQDDGVGTLLSNVATVYITVTGRNDAPTAVEDTYFVVEDNTLTVLVADGILDNDTDPEHDSLTAGVVTDAQNGTLGLNPDGSFTYTPDPDFVGVDTFTYQANDSDALSNIATVTITITSENDPPTANDDTLTVGEDSATTSVDVLTNDSFAPDTGETLSITAVGATNNSGTAVQNGINIDYTPALNFSGTELFTYTISDGSGGSDTATVTVTVTPDNDNPIIGGADPVNITISEDSNPTPFSLSLSASDVDNTDSTLSWRIVSPGASNGTAGASTPGSSSAITYVPNANYYGSDSFIVEVSDNNGGTDTITVNITIESVNDNPTAKDDTPTVVEDSGTTSLDVLTNDSFAPDTGETLSITAVGATNNSGTAVQNGINIDYTPDLNFSGTEVFTYTISDGDSGTDTATVTVTVTPENDDPIIAETSPESRTISEDSNPTPFGTLTLNASDVESADSSLAWSISTPASHGTANATTPGSSSSITYTPDPNYNGSDSFVVEVSDGTGGTDTFTVNVTIDPINDNPDAVDDTPVVNEQSVNNTLTVLSNDTFAPDSGETLFITAVGATNNGGTAANNTTNITYTPDPTLIGTEVFTYTISDGNGGTDTAMVTVTVQNVNFDPEITEGVSTTVNMDEDGTPTAFSLTLNATDPDGDDPLTWSISTQAGNGTASATGNGLSKAIDYTPNGDYNGSDSFIVQVSDNNGGTDTITVNVTIDPINDDPTANDDTPTVDEQSSNNTLTVLGNDTYAPDTGETLMITAVGATNNDGTATNNTTNIIYTPDPTFIGTEVFTYTISDGNGGTDTATVMVTVQDVNFAPVITEGVSTTVSMDEDSTPTSFSLTLNATDADSDTLTWSISSQGASGTAVTNGTGNAKAIDYTPNANYNGSDSFVVQVIDGNGGTDDITVNVNISPQNDDPTATDDDATTPLDTAVLINVLDNDDDIDGDTLVVLAVTNGISGTVTNHGTHVEYTPATGFEGIDTFTYTASDGNGGTVEATVTVVVGKAYTVFLPMITNNFISAPDLVVTEITASSDLIEVVIENQGNAPVINSFWVDFYINPSPAPTAANELWPELAAEGLAWGVTDSLAVGETITLTFSTEPGAPNEYFVAEESLYYGSLPAGTSVYAQADSARAGVGLGAVAELDELTGKPYNNILGGTAVAPK